MNMAHDESAPTRSPTRAKINHDWTNPAYTRPLSEFQRFIRDGVDWQKSPLGPIDQWPTPLRQMVLIAVADPAPAGVYYGHPDETAIIYNEAYTGLIGSKHPNLQGQLARVEFQEIWDHFDKLLRSQMETGLTSVGEAHPLLLRRHGFLEESYFSFKFIPILSPEDGSYLGTYATVTEHTAEVLFERRMATVQRLGNEVAEATTLNAVWQAVINGLTVNEFDVPFAALYSLPSYVAHGPGSQNDTLSSVCCALKGSLGFQPEKATIPDQFDLHDASNQLALVFQESAKYTGTTIVRRADNKLPTELFLGGQRRGHKVECEAAVICAIKDNVRNCTIGFLLLGLNPYRPYDTPYQDFVRLLTKQVTTPHVSNVLLREQVEADRAAATQSALERVQLDERLAAKIAAYEDSELKFARFADSLSMGVGIVDHNGSLIYGNKRWHSLLGTVEEDPAPFSFLNSIEPGQVEVARGLWADLEAKKPVNTIVSFQTRWTAPDGQQHPTTALVTAYTDLDSHGRTRMMSCIADVSELKWIEDRLRQRTAEVEQSELRYRKFADLAPVGVCVMCRQRIIQFTNDAFLKIMPHSTISQDMLICVHPEDQAEVETKLASLTDTASSVTFECRLLRTTREGSHNDDRQADRPRNADHTRYEHRGDGKEPPAWILASAHLERNP